MENSDIPKLNGLRMVPLGGLGEIGMNCMVLETDDEMVVVDCGLLFSDLDHFGVEFAIPDFTYIKERKDKLKAFVITHGHEDHIGALPFALKSGLNVPVYASPFTSVLLRERLREHGLEQKTEVRTFRPGAKFEVGKFKIQTVSVNHSIIDASALIIDTPMGRVIHTGDFKIDATPFYGSKIDMATFKKAGDEGVLLLMSDSTNVERHEHSMSESVIYQTFEKLFAAAEGLTVVSMFASNVGRMGQVFDIARKLDKKIILAGRTMEQNVRLGAEVGYLKDAANIVIPLDALEDYPRDQVIVLSTGSQGEHRSALVRIAMGEHSTIELQEGDLVVMSSKFIPGNEKAIGKMINNLFKQGAEVLYEAVHDIHVSGHATRPELKEMLDAVKPRYFLPIHGEYRHLVHHAKLARETGVKDENVVIAVNGDILEVDRDRFEIVHHMEEPRVLVEGREGGDISKIVLKDRRQMGEKGIVFSLMVRNAESRRIISGPEIITRGLVKEDREGWLIQEAKKIASRVIKTYEADVAQGVYSMDLQETIRVELRRFFNNELGKKPVVLPIILDL
ncbi:MAG TPA: ribonuclease J [Bdellovibrionota bacterium]|nr:ribonuclease J [Bdellovibrionota bacterium]